MVVLGFDGLDPRLVRQGIAAGRLPTLARLAGQGTLLDLETTTPPQSPVAWSSFATGLRPGSHGVLGLVTRDPATYAVEEATITLEPPLLWAGVALRGPRATLHRRGETFWQVADAQGISSVVLQAPYELPPAPLRHGRILSGVGVPDVRGASSGFTLFTTAPAMSSDPPGGTVARVAWRDERARAEIPGLRVAGYQGDAIALQIARDGDGVRIEVGDARLRLGLGQWSDWVPLDLRVTPFFSVRALCRLHLEAIEPELRLYLSSLSYDPRDPELAISAPAGFAEQIAKHLGLFQTLGWSEPTAALEAGALGETAFLEDVLETMKFSRRLLLHEIDQRDAQLVVAVLTAPDRIAHMFHRFVDPRSPLYDEAGAARYGEVIDRSYDAVDQIVEDVLQHLPASSRLLIVSDHGFHAFDRQVNLDTWLEARGWMKRIGDGAGLEGVVWGETRAYAVGIGELYLNLRGREAQGIVTPGAEAEGLLEEIERGLLELRDPAGGEAVVTRVDRGARAFAGPFVAAAPDLQVSFVPGYRSSFATARGAAPVEVIEPNGHRWSGDHAASAAEQTPGILLTSFPLTTREASLLDVAPTVLHLLGAAPAPSFEGRVLR